MACLFCQIAEGLLAADIVYQSDEVIAFHDTNPVAPTHILVIPRRHIATANDYTEQDAALIGQLSLTASRIAKELGLAEEGYRLVMNCNRMAGQTVFHTHLHLLAGRPFHWPPG